MNQRKGLLLVLIGLAFSSQALAERVVTLSPVSMFTVHGGMRQSPTAGVYTACVTSDLHASMYNPPFEDGVLRSQHTINLTLSNISAVPQTVNLILRGAGSKVTSYNSDGNLLPIPGVAGPTLPLTDWTSSNQVIPANSTLLISLSAACNNTNCQVIGSYGGSVTKFNLVGGGVYDLSNLSLCPGVRQICISQETTMNLAIKVHEDRGAVIGHLNTSAHRCSGVRDHYLAPPLNYPINGGRPF